MGKKERLERQAEKKAGVDKKWEYFKKCSKEKRESLLSHTFAFCIDDIGSGWEYIHFELDGKTAASYRVSYIGPDVHAFFRIVTDMEETDFKKIVFYDEPGEYPLLFSRRNDVIYVKLYGMEDGVFLKYDDFIKQITEEFRKWYRY